MLDKELGKDIPIEERGEFLKDNCDAVEKVTYSRTYTTEELAKQRETLTEPTQALTERIFKLSYSQQVRTILPRM